MRGRHNAGRGGAGLSRARGSAMLAVVAVTGVVAILLMSMLYQLSAEQASSHTSGRSQQAWTTAMAGVQYAAAMVASDPFDPTLWQDDAGLFRHQLVADDGVDRWYFTVFTAPDDAGSSWRYGVTDEAARLHLNHVTADRLSALPGMDPTRAEAVVAYLNTGVVSSDADDAAADAAWDEDELDDPFEASASGSSSSSSTAGGGPVTPATVDELLVVPEISAAVLYGAASHGARRAGRREGDHGLLDADPAARVGLRHWLTVWSHDPAENGDGEALTAIDVSLQTLGNAGLPPEAVDYLEAHREHAGPITHPAALLDAEIEVSDGQGNTQTLASGVTAADLPELLERIGPADSVPREGRININTAPAAVLARLDGIDEDLAEQITLARDRLDRQARRTIAWLVAEQVIDSDTFREAAPQLTARCAQFRVQVVGYAVPSGAYRVVEAVVDLSAAPPRIRYLRDQTRWGLPFALAGDDLPGSGP